MKIFLLCLVAASILLAGCGLGKTRAELLQEMKEAQEVLTAAQKNSSDPEGLRKAQTAYDAAYLAYHPDFPQSKSGK